ncbi:ImmA/IrrE family metallo-endopeptidase [Spirosoma soli]|uniref:ImmA/IrrE family metallo-endopeptidase n=1 Tax=Spirosoma soli TaxID=1770529 RepID=A0ABW5MC36_9BACT
MNNKFTKAELVAKLVLDECGLDDPTEVTLKNIILGRKAYYEEAPLTGKEGEIVSVGNRSIITINSNIIYETKKRFASAHELGHFEMHRTLSPVFTDTEYDLINWYKSGPQEIEANEFAAEFLMPTDFFYKECIFRKFGPHVIDHLANRFQVSKTAAILKFVKRGNHPVCIVYCKNNKMKWWKSSYDFRYFLEFKFDECPPTGSVAYECFTKGVTYSMNEQKQQIWKSDWFRMRDDEQDSTFYEYCLFAKSYDYTISIIWED